MLVPRVPGAPATEKIGDVRVERFAYFPRRWEDLADGAIIENLRQRRSRWIQVPFFVAAEALRLRRLVRSHRPDVIHVHWVIPQGLAALLVARRVPWVVTTLGGDVYALNGRVARWIKRAVLQRARAVTTMNADMRDRLIDAGADPATTYVQPLGADVASIRAAAAGEDQVAGRILFVGRLVEKKGGAVLIDAVRRLPDDVQWDLEVVGDGPLREQLTTRADGLPVTFSGSASRADLGRAYARSTITVVPSVPAASGDQDGLPTVLIEAMGSRRAVVASDLPGIDAAIEDGSTGVLVPPDDPDALADALHGLLTDPGRRETLAAAAEARVEAFTVDASARRYIEILTAASRSGDGR